MWVTGFWHSQLWFPAFALASSLGQSLGEKWAETNAFRNLKAMATASSAWVNFCLAADLCISFVSLVSRHCEKDLSSPLYTFTRNLPVDSLLSTSLHFTGIAHQFPLPNIQGPYAGFSHPRKWPSPAWGCVTCDGVHPLDRDAWLMKGVKYLWWTLTCESLGVAYGSICGHFEDENSEVWEYIHSNTFEGSPSLPWTSNMQILMSSAPRNIILLSAPRANGYVGYGCLAVSFCPRLIECQCELGGLRKRAVARSPWDHTIIL
jgi:hypothetical protein